MSTPRDTFDVPEVQRKSMLARAARRDKLRVEYLEKVGNPYRMATGEAGTVFDEGLQRYHSMRETRSQYFRPTIKGGLSYIACVVVPIFATVYIFCTAKTREEERYRTGQVSYRDRKYKFT